MLLEAGGDVGAPAHWWGRAPLHIAAQNRNPAVAKLLLEAGANANVRDFAGATPLHLAVASNPNPAVLAVLLDAGADPDAQGERSDCAHWNWSGNLTPLYEAARANRNPDIIAELLATGTDINGRGTHMHLTCESEHPTHVSPMYMAVRYDGHPVMIEALARAGADLELADPDGRTVLHLAAISRATIAGRQPNAWPRRWESRPHRVRAVRLRFGWSGNAPPAKGHPRPREPLRFPVRRCIHVPSGSPKRGGRRNPSRKGNER